MKQSTEDLRNLSDAECDRVSGGRMLTTLALDEEDGGCRGPIMTTMALGVHVGIEEGDVVRDRARQQLIVLGDDADLPAPDAPRHPRPARQSRDAARP